MAHSGQFQRGHKPLGRALPGHVNSPETREKIRQKALGRTPWNKGIPHTEEAKQKMKESHHDVSGEDNPMYGTRRPQPKGKDSPSYKSGIGGYRKRALDKYGYKCFDCGIDNKALLLVHHIDKNRQNNDIKNLQILCRNCHWLKHKDDNKKDS